MTQHVVRAPGQSGRRRTVARRVLFSYAVIMTAFLLAAGWSVREQRSAAREASLMRNGYLPLALALRDFVANQDTWNTQLNHITSALNPADKRVWFETALKIGRPKKSGEVRAKISRAFLAPGDEAAVQVGNELLQQTHEVQVFLGGDRELVDRLFGALNQGDQATAEHLRDQLVTRGYQGKKLLSRLERRVERNIDLLLDQARQRERQGAQLLIFLVVLTLCVGLLMALYASRMLRPLTLVTARAQAVADGDLAPQKVVVSNDEIGELASTFESMVAAIKEANEKLVAQERLATIGKMAAHVTHEIRNPLSSIALNIELLEEEFEEQLGNSKEAAGLVRAMGKEVDRLSELSSQYLTMAKQRRFDLEEESLDDLVKEACEFMRAELARHQIDLELVLGVESQTARVDAAELKQALYNLVRNAREAMPDGGVIRVSVTNPVGGGVDIRVDDEGGGVSQRARENLFDPFFSTKSHGTGLGLAITRQIVEAHGGTIACEARPEGGTSFLIHLPLAAQSTSTSAPVSVEEVTSSP